MSTRPSRRTAARRPAVVDSDDELDDSPNRTIKPEEDEEDFTPAPKKSPRKAPAGRRKTIADDASTIAPVAATRRPGRPRKSVANTTMADTTVMTDATENIDPDITASTQMGDETVVMKKTAPRSRKSLAPSKASKPVKSELEPTQLPTPEPSASPETTKFRTIPPPSGPLTDITGVTVNEKPSAHRAIENTLLITRPIKPFESVMAKPADIMLKSRTMAQFHVEDNTPKARLVITYLILNNFKSYAGRQEVGPFHASFSSVVGPNGSGKSNVIDSLLFVFGFRASKMRQGKLSALIHSSAQYPDLDHCEVAVHFREVMDQPGGEAKVMPDSDLIISRKAFRNNSSTYYMNGKASNFTTVTTLLRERGVDLDHKRFLILQGEVESIAQMKPKAGNEHEDGLLEYLEDIIGTSKYKTPIEESATEVEALNEVCIEKSSRVQHVEKERSGLESKKDKALAYLRDENDLAMKQSALYQLYTSECNSNLVVTQEAIEQIQARLNDELERHQGSEDHIKSLRKAHTSGSKGMEIQEKECQGLVKQMAEFEQERVKFDEKRKFLKDKRQKLDKSIANAEKASMEADESIAQCTRDIDDRAAQVVEHEQQLLHEEAEFVKIRDGLKGKTQVFSDQIAAKQKSLEPWQDKINQEQSSLAVAESEMAILKEKANAGAVALQDLQNKIGLIEDGQRTRQQELDASQIERADLEKEAKVVAEEMEVLHQNEPKLRNKLSNARQKADEARSSLAATQTQGTVLTALTRMKDSGRIEGFYGRLGNLGTIDEKYDVAISTACGSLDNFVTETVEAGQQCIEYLRKTNLGRGNFICLDKLRGRDYSRISTPEDAPRLFDLVKSKDDKFNAAFYHALQDTLVAADLAQANRIAYGVKRWRVVTLAGELIDKSGTMSGGGTTVKKGLMSSKAVAGSTKEQVAKLEEDRDALEARLQEFQDHHRDLEARLRYLRDQIPKVDIKMQKINLENESSTRNLADARKRIDEISEEHQPSKSDDARIAALTKDISRSNKVIENLRAETASVEDEIKALQDKIMEIGGEKLRTRRAIVDQVKANIASRNDEISAAEVKRAKAEKQKTKLQKDLAKANKELQAAQEALAALENDVQSQDDKAATLKTHVDDAREGVKVKQQALAEIKAELDEKTAELNATRAVEIEMRNKLEEHEKVLSDNQKKVRYWAEKHAKLFIQDVADLESGASKSATDEAAASRAPASEESADNSSDNSVANDSRVNEIQAEAETTTMRDAKAKTELPLYSPDELADMDKEVLKGEIAALEENTQNVNVDLGVLAEYRRRVQEHASRSSDLATAVAQRDVARRRCDELRRMRLEGFVEGFSIISLRLKEMYQMITMGGNAELELVDSLDPFSEGILFSVMPPKKSWKNISNLSGGEKTLSSLALVFALHHYKPTPLYVMDEIDAALDFRNVSIVANYIRERTKNAQFIVISLRNNMFELASRLVGVYKVNHMTKSVTIENKDYIVGRAAQQQQQQARQQRKREETMAQTQTPMFGGGNTTTLAFRR